MSLPRKLDRDELPDILRRYLGDETTPGESIQTIAAEKGVNRRTLYRYLLGGLGEEKYHEAVTQALVARIADADDELEAARGSGDSAKVSAARETCKFTRMDFERRRPHLYGQKQTNVNVTAVVADAGLVQSASELLALARERKLPALKEKVVEGAVVQS